MLIFLLLWVTLQQCLVNHEAQVNFYKQSNEILRINLFDYFYGFNLEFEAEGYDIQNVLNQLDTQQTMGQIVDSSLLVSQYSKQWLNMVAVLIQNNTAYFVEILQIEDNNLVEKYSLYIPQQQYQVQCNQIAFFDFNTIIVDCYYINNTKQTQFFVCNINDEYSWEILNYQTTFNQSQLFESNIQVVLNNQSEIIIIKGSYNINLYGIVEIYSFADLKSQSQTPIQVFDNLPIRQFQVDNYQLYLMNITNVVLVYSLDQNYTQVKLYNLTTYITGAVELLAFDIEIEQDTILLYTSIIGENLFQMTSQNLIRKYAVRIDFTLNSIPQLYSNPELIGLQINNAYYIYDRLKPNVIINTQDQYLINLNQLPYNILTYTNNELYYYQILEPSFFINSTTNSIINITATSIEQEMKINCQVSLNVTMHSINPNISSYENSLPDQLIVKSDNIFYNVLKLVSGPLLRFGASAEQSGIFLWNPSSQRQLSSQIWDQIAGVFSFYSADFQSYALFMLRYEYSKEIIKNSFISLRLCDIYSLTEYIELDTMECTEYTEVYTLNAPINKLQFTDLTDPDEVYFVADIARSGVVIYKLTQLNVNQPIQSTFLCEPLPRDENNFQHVITDFYVIGGYLYFLLARISQIWIYDISTCDKLFIISNEFVDGNPFYPKSLAGITIFDEENKMRQIIFINSVSNIYVLEMVNKVPVFQNIIQLDQGSNIISITVIRDTLIAVVQDLYGISSIFQYFYSIDQPTNDIVFIKKLPQYGVGINSENIVASDHQLFYILMNNNQYYVYNPRLPSQECLLYQIDYIGNYISSAYIPNTLKQSMVAVASLTNIALYSFTNPIVMAASILDSANISQKSSIIYNIEIQSFIASNQVNIVGKLIAYDTMFEGRLNYGLVAESNNLTDTITIDSSSHYLQLDLEEALQNNVVAYYLENLVYNFGVNSTLYPPLNFMSELLGTPQQIKSLTFNPNSDIVYLQCLSGIYTLQNTTYTKIVPSYNQYSHCYAMSFDQYSQVLLSLCSFYQSYTFTYLTTTNGNYTTYQINNEFYLPLKIQYINNLISILAIKQGERSYSLILGSITNNTYQTNINIECIITNAEQVNGGDIGDYFITYTNNGFLILFTCPILEQVQYATISTNGQSLLNQSILHLPQALPKVTLSEIVLMDINTQNIQFIVTTKEFYSFIITANLTISNGQLQLIEAQQNKSIAPMQFANSERKALYYNGYFFAVFHDPTHGNYKLAIYDLTNPQLNIYYSLDTITLTYPIQYTITGLGNYLYIMQGRPPIYMYNYTNKVGVYLGNATYDYTILGLDIFQQYGDPQLIPLRYYYPMPGATPDWVRYTCIGVGALYVLSLIGTIAYFGHLKRKEAESDDQLSMELNQR